MEKIKCKENNCGLYIDFEGEILVVSALKTLVETKDLADIKLALEKTASQLQDKNEKELEDLFATEDEGLESSFDEINNSLKKSQWVIFYLACSKGHEQKYRIKIKK